MSTYLPSLMLTRELALEHRNDTDLLKSGLMARLPGFWDLKPDLRQGKGALSKDF